MKPEDMATRLNAQLKARDEEIARRKAEEERLLARSRSVNLALREALQTVALPYFETVAKGSPRFSCGSSRLMPGQRVPQAVWFQVEGFAKIYIVTEDDHYGIERLTKQGAPTRSYTGGNFRIIEAKDLTPENLSKLIDWSLQYQLPPEN